MRKKIGVFDSGVGGATTAAEIQKMLPEAKIIYYGDSKNCPYGERTKEDLVRITSGIVQTLVDQGAGMIVIACNTATTQCIHELRKCFPGLTFVGTEPAIKVACDRGCENILLLATPNTVKSKQVERLVTKYIAHQKITLLPCPGLADLVERLTLEKKSLENNAELEKLLQNLFSQVQHPEQIDGVVLGCTHYVYLKPQIQKYFPQACLVDGNQGVAKRVRELVLDER